MAALSSAGALSGAVTTGHDDGFTGSARAG